jgi:hypothetical protein
MRLLIIFFVLHVSVFSFSQTVSFSQKKIDKYLLKPKEAPVDDSNKVYGAGLSIDGSIMRIIFNEFKWNKKKNMVTMKGTIYRYANVIDDELRLPGIQIFLAKEIRDTLKNVKVLGYSDSNIGNEGNFKFAFKINQNSKLYFHGGSTFYLNVYDIWRLIH